MKIIENVADYCGGATKLPTEMCTLVRKCTTVWQYSDHLMRYRHKMYTIDAGTG